MAGFLPPPSGAGGSVEDRILRTTAERRDGVSSPSESSNITGRKFVFGTPTSQLSSNTDILSSEVSPDTKLTVGDVGMSPVRDFVGKVLHPRKNGAHYSEDNANPLPSRTIAQSDGQDANHQEEEGDGRDRRWNSARTRLGSVLSAGHHLRESISIVRRKSVDPSHLMNDLNSRESRSRADQKPASVHGSGQQSPPPPDVAAATFMTDNILPSRTEQAPNVPDGSSPPRFSSKFSTWKHHLGTPKGRGRESPQGREGSATVEQPRSSSTPPPQKFKVRVNRFLRSGRRSVNSKTGSPASETTAPTLDSRLGNLESLASTSNAQTTPEISSAESSTIRGSPRSVFRFREAVRRGVSSARRRMSVPFLSSTPPPSVNNAPFPAVESPERPQTVPLERGAVLRTPGGSEFCLNGEPGHSFLPTEAMNFVPPAAPPVISENPQEKDWHGRDFENISMIQSRPPLSPPGMEELPPLSPWMKASGEPQPWLKLTTTPPKLPEISSVAPFAVDELIAPDFAAAKGPSGGQNVSDFYWSASGSGVNKNEVKNSKNKGKERASSNASEHLRLPSGGFYLETSSGKSIEVLDEEKRRKSRDTGVMGLDPEVTPRSDLPSTSGSGEKDDDGEFTYAAAVRDIAGLGRSPKRPPPDTSTDDVSVPMPECDYDLPLPNFRFSILPEPSSSSNEPDASPCAASSSVTQVASGSAVDFVSSAPTHARISLCTNNTATTTAHTTTAASTNPSTSITSDYTPYNYQMLLSSKKPYLFVLQELSSGTYIKITPQTNSSPVSRSLSTLTPSYPETPAPSQTSPTSVRFVGFNGLLPGGAKAYEEVDDDSVDEEEDEGWKGKGTEKKRK